MMRDFPGLFEADRQKESAAQVLRGAVEQLEADVDGGWDEQARHLRGIAVVVHAAAMELAVLSGWNAAAEAAAGSGVLDEEPTHG